MFKIIKSSLKIVGVSFSWLLYPFKFIEIQRREEKAYTVYKDNFYRMKRRIRLKNDELN